MNPRIAPTSRSICAHVFIVRGNGAFTLLLPLLTRNGSPESTDSAVPAIANKLHTQVAAIGGMEAIVPGNCSKCKAMALSPAATMDKDASVFSLYPLDP
ncbi:GD17759 [Drosophila simulans]|uniref:GD17759 n=1 Tax=Drosophila simulans TaxID=7240 RepID=B4QTQ8_DROSI|nr:GD17759 [Drosophila simulans]